MKHTNRGPIMRRHPLTGQPIQPVGVVGNRVIWPIMGGDETAGTATDETGTTGSTDNSTGTATDAGTETGTTSGESAKGFPANTPVADMTPEQQAAYHLHQSRKHEDRAKGWQSAFPGKTAAEIKAIVDAAEANRRNTLTLDEKTIEDAKNQAREEATREYGPKSVRAAFDLLLGDMPEQERNDEIDLLDLSKFLKENGDVDTAKVRQFAQKIAPPVKDEGTQRRNYGQGKHTHGQSSGMAAGADMYAASRNKSTTNS